MTCLTSSDQRLLEDGVPVRGPGFLVHYEGESAAERKSTCFCWVHRDAPQQVKEPLRLLAYTGIVSERASGIKATRGEIGTRYAVNLGCMVALESSPAATAFQIASNLTPRGMSEYGANHRAYQTLLAAMPTFDVSSAGSEKLAGIGAPDRT
jgi:hypothetical protein